MLHIIISALTMEEAETMLRLLDKWIRFHFNNYGAHRRTSWNRRANDGIRAQIRVDLPEVQWRYIQREYCFEIAEKLEKSITWEEIFPGIVELSTEESAI